MDETKFTDADYDGYIDQVQEDYATSLKKLSKWYKRLSTARAVCIISTPLVLILDIYPKQAAAILTVIASILEFYINFKDYSEKIDILNRASNDLNYQYNLYSSKVEIYSEKDDNEIKKLYVEKTAKIIRDADNKTYCKYNSKANNLSNKTND